MNKYFKFIFLLSFYVSYSQLSFQDSATEFGVGVSYGGDAFGGGGVSFCDFDGDGWDDITYATKEGEEVYFYKNNNGTFELIDLGINDIYRTKQVIWIDYDNDGDKDFFATSTTGFNKFYQNDGSMNFADITSTCGLFLENKDTYGASFGDIDNDGDLDVMICNRDAFILTEHSYLYRNDSGTYVDITASAGLTTSNQASFTAAFFDYNNDGYQDIYIANDFSSNINRLYENDGDGTFTDVSVSSQAGIAIEAMSTTIGDYNNDGWFDIYITNTHFVDDGNELLKNTGNGKFVNVAPITGTTMNSWAWGSVFLDADNDADMDLYVSSKLNGSTPALLPSAFYENQGDDTYLIPTGIGFANDTRQSYSNAIGDFNNDGYPDIIVLNLIENNFLWENTTSNSNNWVKIDLTGVTSNKDGIGSKIEVNAGGISQFRYTLAGEGYIAQNSNSEFIGLADATTIDYIKVTWLSGTVDTFNNISPNQTLNIIEGQALSVNEYDLATVQLFPNPISDKLNIRLDNTSITDFKVELFNLLGKKVLSEDKEGVYVTIDLSNYASGIYVLKCTIKDKVITKKVIIE